MPTATMAPICAEAVCLRVSACLESGVWPVATGAWPLGAARARTIGWGAPGGGTVGFGAIRRWAEPSVWPSWQWLAMARPNLDSACCLSRLVARLLLYTGAAGLRPHRAAPLSLSLSLPVSLVWHLDVTPWCGTGWSAAVHYRRRLSL